MRFWKRRQSGKGEENLSAVERQKRRERNGFFSTERTKIRRERLAKLAGILGGNLLGTNKIGMVITFAIFVALAVFLKRFLF